MTTTDFQQQVLAWFDVHGRKTLPWQVGRNPYVVWISEIMLQQTQVVTVIPFFETFIRRFPDITTLADATVDDVIAHWAGLGYYARARNLHRAALWIKEQHDGGFPASLDALEALPGIGRSTAGAILSLGMNRRAAILDGNVRRVLSRYSGMTGWPGEAATLRDLWKLAEQLTPEVRFADYNQAMMDLGAMICRRSRPACSACPISAGCVAFRDGLTGTIPAPRPKKVLPVRECWMLLLLNQAGQVWLERRPPAGIWGGLMSLPEYDTFGDLRQGCQQRLIDAQKLRPLAARRHTFSHYHLDFTPVVVRDMPRDQIAEKPDGQWLKPEQATGLPAPIRKLLEEPLPFD